MINLIPNLKLKLSRARKMRRAIPVATAIMNAKIAAQERFKTPVDYNEIAHDAVKVIDALTDKIYNQ